MHVCENNCALTVEDEIEFWGLDDTLLQVFLSTRALVVFDQTL